MNYVKGVPIFTKINNVPKQYPYLTENTKTEVIIVGGGVTGAILGYYFNQNNIPAVILEKSRLAHTSTSITTSLLQYELDRNAADLKSYQSQPNILKTYQLGLSAIDNISNIMETYGNHCNFKRCNSLLYGSKKSDKPKLYDEYTFRKNAGLDVEFIEEFNSTYNFSISCGVVAKNGGAVFDPYQFTHQLLDTSYRNGLCVYENSEVVSVEYNEDGVKVQTVYGYEVKGKIVICATGYNTSLFTKREFGTKSTTFNIATKPIPELSNTLKNTIFRDNELKYHYFRATHDNRLIIGGEDVRFIPDIDNQEIRARCYGLLEQRLKQMFPMYSIETEYQYCGAFESTYDDLGFIGKDKDKPNLWYCLGYGANGILFAILGAQMLVKLYNSHTDENLYLFEVNRFKR